MDIENFGKSQKPVNSKYSLKGIIITGLTGGAALAISIFAYPFISPALRRVCLPYVPATNQQILNVFCALKGRRGTFIDIGSGDGRIVVAAAKRGFQAFGIELNLWLVLYSRWVAWRSCFSSTTFFRGDLWKLDYRPYENIVIFGVKEMMQELSKKFDNELKDTYVVACRFPIPDKVPMKILGSGIDRVWLYHYKVQ